MRRKINLAALFAAFGLALALVFTACNNGSSPVFATCVVSYSSERGTPPAQKTVFAGTTLSEADLPALTAEGYVFGGWFDGETQAVAGKYVVAKNVTLMAKWTAAPTPAGSVIVTFDANGGTITTTTQTVPKNTATALTAAAALGLSRDGFVFGGWGTTNSATTAAYADGANVTLSEALTLYAIWTAAPATTYSVTVNSGSASPASAAAGTTVTITAAAPVTGKIFDKWTTTSGVTFADVNASSTTFTMPESDVTVEATYIDGIDLSTVTADTVIPDGCIVTGTLGSPKKYKISIAAGAKVTLKNVAINGYVSGSNCKWAGLTCEGDAEITLVGTNKVTGFYNKYPGVFVPSGNTLTIKGSGSLTAKSNGAAAGIGAGSETGLNCGNIIIEGGSITATGTTCFAGIGAGQIYTCGDITISGGTINATGGQYAAAIGAGGFSNSGSLIPGDCGNITISGGSITATGGKYAAAIGSGGVSGSGAKVGKCGNISITGGTVTATGNNGPGIGVGAQGDCSDKSISITGGTVNATGNGNAAGIGCSGEGSGYAKCGTITIGSGVTQVTATKGADAVCSIGKGNAGNTCGAITIGGTEYADGMATSPYTYQP